MIQGHEFKKIINAPLTIEENIRKVKEDLSRIIDQAAESCENSIYERNMYKFNPIHRFYKNTIVDEDENVRKTIAEWLGENGYKLEWNSPQNAYCVYIKD